MGRKRRDDDSDDDGDDHDDDDDDVVYASEDDEDDEDFGGSDDDDSEFGGAKRSKAKSKAAPKAKATPQRKPQAKAKSPSAPSDKPKAVSAKLNASAAEKPSKAPAAAKPKPKPSPAAGTSAGAGAKPKARAKKPKAVADADADVNADDVDLEIGGTKAQARAPKRRAAAAAAAAGATAGDLSDDLDADDFKVSDDDGDFELSQLSSKGRAAGKAAGSAAVKPARKAARVGAAMPMAPFTDDDIQQVLHTIRGLRSVTALRPQLTLKELGITDACEVADLEAHTVLDGLERLVLSSAEDIMGGQAPSFDVPSRAASNQQYVPELDRIVLRGKAAPRKFLATNTVRKVAIMMRVMQLMHQVLLSGIHVTKRDLFYTDVKLFVDQQDSDAVLDDIACTVGCTRTSLHVVASEKGIVVGRIQFRDDGDLIDCTRMGVGGKAIPPFIDRITDISSDADFILLVEKDAAFMRLAEDRFYNRFPCIIITAKGQPDVATRLFLRKVKTELNLPVFGLVDSDPYGLKILSVYMSGSKNMSYDSANLTTPDIKWLGVRPSDLDRYNIPEQCRLKMTDSDLKTGKDLLEEDFIKQNPAWTEELRLMIQTKEKAEIQALSSFGFQYLTQVYLPQKLKAGDWI